MTNVQVALGALSSGQKLELLALERGWLPLGPWPWRFQAGKSRGFTTPSGAEVHFIEQTVLGAWVLFVQSETDELFRELVKRLELTTVDKLEKDWKAAKKPVDKVRALLRLGAAQSMTGGVAIAAFEAAVRKGLDDKDAVVRLAAIRSLAIAPAQLGKTLLEGREDPDNPKIRDWYELFSSLSAQG